MNTQGIPINRKPYTFSFACSDENTDIQPNVGRLIDIVIPITFTATKIAISFKEHTGNSVIVIVRNGIVVKSIAVSSQYTITSGLGLVEGDTIWVNTLNMANGSKGLKIYFVGYT